MTGQRVGYVCVSTLDQNTLGQHDGVDVDRTFEDKASGKDQNRPKLEEMIDFVRRHPPGGPRTPVEFVLMDPACTERDRARPQLIRRRELIAELSGT